MSTYYIAGQPCSDELFHYGIRDMHWGVRRFQYEDRTLTPAGKERYRKAKEQEKTRKKQDKAEYKESRKRIIRDAANVHKMSDAELLQKIGRLEKEMRLMELSVNRLTSSGDPSKNMMIQAGKKVAGAALAGVGAYAGMAILTGEFNPKTLASYMFANPNKKK